MRQACGLGKNHDGTRPCDVRDLHLRDEARSAEGERKAPLTDPISQQLTIKLRPRAEGEHIKVDIFMGYSENRALTGTLTLRVGEFQLFAVSLSMGADLTKGRVKFEMDRELERVALAEADA